MFLCISTFFSFNFTCVVTSFRVAMSAVCPLCMREQVAGRQLIYDRQSVGQSVLVSGAHLGPVTNFSFSLKFLLDSYGFVILYRPLWREDGSVNYCTIASGPCQSSHSYVEVPQKSRPYLTVSSETPPTWRARSQYFEATSVQCEISNITIGRAAWEACSATWNLGTNSAFALGPRKTTGNLDRVGRSQDLPNATDF
jgi:hypothetical protein